jgi:hypothetical protein
MTRHVTPMEAENLGHAEIRDGGIIAASIGVLTLASLIVGTVSAAAVLPDLAWFVFVGIFLVGGASITAVLIFALRRRSWIVNAVVEGWQDLWDAENKAKAPTPILPPALPATLPQENRVIQVTAGDRVVGVPLNPPVHGFEESDLVYLCELVAGGYKFTEENMEKLILPSSRLPMGKAQEGTPYSKFMQLCGDAGIIEGRKPKYSGKLVVTDPAEMMLLIKALPETDTLNA